MQAAEVRGLSQGDSRPGFRKEGAMELAPSLISCVSAKGGQESTFIYGGGGRDRQALGHLLGLLGSRGGSHGCLGAPGEIATVRKRWVRDLGSWRPGSQLESLVVITLLHSPVLRLSFQRPVTEPVVSDTHFYLALAVNLCGLCSAFQTCSLWRKNLDLVLLTGNESKKLRIIRLGASNVAQLAESY